jgi:hypothetical protein
MKISSILAIIGIILALAAAAYALTGFPSMTTISITSIISNPSIIVEFINQVVSTCVRIFLIFIGSIVSLGLAIISINYEKD